MAALALSLLVPAAALLLELSLAQPARPALAASMAIAAIAATAHLSRNPGTPRPRLQDQENYYPERAGVCPSAPDSLMGKGDHDPVSLPGTPRRGRPYDGLLSPAGQEQAQLTGASG